MPFDDVGAGLVQAVGERRASSGPERRRRARARCGAPRSMPTVRARARPACDFGVSVCPRRRGCLVAKDFLGRFTGGQKSARAASQRRAGIRHARGVRNSITTAERPLTARSKRGRDEGSLRALRTSVALRSGEPGALANRPVSSIANAVQRRSDHVVVLAQRADTASLRWSRAVPALRGEGLPFSVARNTRV